MSVGASVNALFSFFFLNLLIMKRMRMVKMMTIRIMIEIVCLLQQDMLAIRVNKSDLKFKEKDEEMKFDLK